VVNQDQVVESAEQETVTTSTSDYISLQQDRQFRQRGGNISALSAVSCQLSRERWGNWP